MAREESKAGQETTNTGARERKNPAQQAHQPKQNTAGSKRKPKQSPTSSQHSA
jgi:hypothetical protein